MASLSESYELPHRDLFQPCKEPVNNLSIPHWRSGCEPGKRARARPQREQRVEEQLGHLTTCGTKTFASPISSVSRAQAEDNLVVQFVCD